MLKIGVLLISVVILGVGLFTLRSYFSSNDRSLSSYIQGLISAPNQDGVLVISVAETPKFVQFTGGFESVQMDFPLVTSEQRAFRDSIEAVADSMSLTSVINIGTDGSEFLDYNLYGNPTEISNVVETFLSKLYGETAMENLRFEKNGY